MNLSAAAFRYLLPIAIFLFVISLFFIRFRLRVIYGDPDKDGPIEIGLSVAGLPYFALPNPLPSKKGGSNKGKPRFDVTKIMDHFMHDDGIPAPGLFSSDRVLISFQTIESLKMRTTIGTGDASSTAIIMGVLWGIQSALISTLFNRVEFIHRPDIEVIPDFDNLCLDIYVNCIFRFTIGEIIHAAWPRLFDGVRLKGGDVTNAK